MNVVHSPLYINQAYASVNGYFGIIKKGKDHPNYGKLGENNPKSIKFWAISPDGIKYLATGIRQFARLHNLNSSKIVAVLKGKRCHHKNWTFGYIEEFRQQIQKGPRDRTGKNSSNFDHSIYKFFNTETQEVFEGHRFDFMHKYGISNSGVYLINKKRKHCCNWILVEN